MSLMSLSSIIKHGKDKIIRYIKLSRLLTPIKNDGVRVIIEGGFYDDWHRHHIDVEIYNIPQDVTKVHIAQYGLDLVAKLDGNVLKKFDAEPEETKTLELDYNFFFRIQRPTTLITEDGRVYHDLQLLHSKDGSNSQRLASFLNTIKEKYGGSGFDRTYKEKKN